MDRSTAKAYVDSHLAKLARLLGIEHWDIKVELVSQEIAGGATADCSRLYDYNKAYIRLSFDDMENEEELARILRHELFHIIICPFDLFRSMAETLARPDSPEEEMMARAFRHSQEKSVVNLERMFHGLCGEPAPPGAPDGATAIPGDEGFAVVPPKDLNRWAQLDPESSKYTHIISYMCG